jgi:Arc/MetJ family transcription regulator
LPAALTFLHTLVCQTPHMATNLQIDPELLEHALRVSGHRTKRETVTEALTEYIQHREQLKILELFGTVDPADMLTDEEMRAQRRRS